MKERLRLAGLFALAALAGALWAIAAMQALT